MRLAAFIALLCGAISCTGYCQDKGAATTVAMPQVKRVMQQYVDNSKVAGVVTMVSHRGNIVFFDAVGNAHTEAKLPMKKDTIFRIYSMSKPITSVAAMILVEQGKLKLDEPISTYLPAMKNVQVFVSNEGDEIKSVPAERAPTVRDLMRHTSGLTYGLFTTTAVDGMYLLKGVMSRKQDLAQMVQKLGQLPLLYQPGTKFNYSLSTDVLGHIVEVVSEQKLDEFFTKQIFEPLKMVDTGFHVPAEKKSRLAAVYSPTLVGGLSVMDAPETSDFLKKPNWLSGGGGLVSTATDYMRFCQMLLRDGELDGVRILKSDTIREMTKDQLPVPAFPIGIGGGTRPGVGFGLGFNVIVKKAGNPSNLRIGEYGWGGAASTHFWISDADDLAVVVLTQRMPYTGQMEEALKSVIYDAID